MCLLTHLQCSDCGYCSNFDKRDTRADPQPVAFALPGTGDMPADLAENLRRDLNLDALKLEKRDPVANPNPVPADDLIPFCNACRNRVDQCSNMWPGVRINFTVPGEELGKQSANFCLRKRDRVVRSTASMTGLT
jgi:hypothetical protein